MTNQAKAANRIERETGVRCVYEGTNYNKYFVGDRGQRRANTAREAEQAARRMSRNS